MSLSFAQRRLKTELDIWEKERSKKEINEPFRILEVNNFMSVLVELDGPEDTPYEGGKFLLRLTYVENYPFVPCRARFLTPIYHPNIGLESGNVALDILQDEWSSIFTIRIILWSIQQLLTEPNCRICIELNIGRQMRENYAEYLVKARKWTETLAKSSSEFGKENRDEIFAQNLAELVAETNNSPIIFEESNNCVNDEEVSEVFTERFLKYQNCPTEVDSIASTTVQMSDTERNICVLRHEEDNGNEAEKLEVMSNTM